MKTPIDKVFDYFYSKVEDYEFLTLAESDLREDLTLKLEMAIATYDPKEELTIDDIYEEFNREVSNTECIILSLYLLCEWLSPQVYSIENLKSKMSQKDFQMHSEANFLKEKRELYNQAIAKASAMATKKGHIAKARAKVRGR